MPLQSTFPSQLPHTSLLPSRLQTYHISTGYWLPASWPMFRGRRKELPEGMWGDHRAEGCHRLSSTIPCEALAHNITLTSEPTVFSTPHEADWTFFFFTSWADHLRSHSWRVAEARSRPKFNYLSKFISGTIWYLYRQFWEKCGRRKYHP